MNLVALFKRFPTQESCIEFLENIRFKDGKYCLYCGSKKVCSHNLTNKTTRNADRLQCQSCNRSFSVTVGTIFHRTHFDLRYWFYIISLILSARKGISACQVARDLNARRPTVWAIMHRIRKAMNTEQQGLLKGIFEMDETYIKSKKRKDDDDNNEGGIRRVNNTSVVAIKQRGGNIKAFATQDTKSHTLLEIAMNIAEEGSEIQTDEYSAYDCFKVFYNHKPVKHALEYVSSEGIHCNGVEGFWSLLKRGIKGQFHHISKKYLQAYINEFEYRYNNRENKDVFDDLLNKMIFCK